MFSNKKLFFLLALSCVIGSSVAQNCTKCLPNMAYCEDETHFRVCSGGQPILSGSPIECSPDTFCTNSPDICSAEDPQKGIVKQCTTNSSAAGGCGNCAGRRFTCVTKTAYAFCKNGVPFAPTPCEGTNVCSVELDDDPNTTKLCAPPNVLTFLELSPTCSNTATTTTTPGPSTTPTSTDSLVKLCLDAESEETNRFYYIINSLDATGRSYIYCERQNEVMKAVLFTCKTGYYDCKTRKCVATRPTNC